MQKTFHQLEIWWVDLEPVRGHETQKKRPCVIIQADIMNSGTRTLLVAPLLPEHKNWPFAVDIRPTRGNGIDKPRHLNLKQVRAVDISRLSKRQGVLEKSYLPAINEALSIIFGL